MTSDFISKFSREVSKQKEPHHNVIYCSPSVNEKLKREFSRGIAHPSMSDNLEIGGLRVEEIPDCSCNHPIAIVCERGEVFPIAENYKSGEVE